MSHRAALAVFTTVALAAIGLLGVASAGAASRREGVASAERACTATELLLAATSGSAQVSFSVGLQLRNRAGAIALEQAVSDPSSPQYRQFLSAARWEHLFSPTQGSVQAVSSWLGSQGITVLGVTPDRMTIHARASAATVEHAFGVSLGEYRHAGHALRLAGSALKLPGSLASLISGVVGVNQTLAKHGALTGAEVAAREREGEGEAEGQEAEAASPAAQPTATGVSRPAGEEPVPPPAGFRNSPPCSGYYGERHASTLPGFGVGYGWPLPWAVCGYVPAQLQGAYNLAGPIAAGLNGKGVTVAVVDAYASPTLQKDAEEYSRRNQPSAALSSSDFSEILPSKYTEQAICEPSGWSSEQTLDVEAVHAMAPGANILYVGGESCVNAGLFEAVQKIVDGHLAQVVTDSWADTGGELAIGEPVSGSEREAFDNVLMMAGTTGIGVQFSSGDEGSNFANLGINVPDYPSVSPYATSVGGTTLEVSKGATRTAEFGWSTSRSLLCTRLLSELELPGCTRWLNTWDPGSPGAYDYGGGGGTAYDYAEPEYQVGVVPAPLAARNSRITGEANRVEPDISVDGDPSTGMKIGETQAFANGVYYDEYRLGGTSLSSPLMAGIMAVADQAAGGPLGFINPLLYKLRGESPTLAPGAFYDELAAGKRAMVRNDYLNSESAEAGLLTSVRGIGYEGLEAYCSGTEECIVQNVALHATPGFDSMTGVGSPGPGFMQSLASAAKAASARP